MMNSYAIKGKETLIFIESPKYGTKKTIIDTSDLTKAKKAISWFVMYDETIKGFYVAGRFRKSRRTIYLHRYLMGVSNPHEIVDHIHHDTLDNRKSELRIVNDFVSSRNRRAFVNNTSGYKGVHWNKAQMKWTAFIYVGSSKIHLGTFNTFEEAVNARQRKELELWGINYAISKS